MSNELDYEHGLPITLQFGAANVSADGVTDLTFPNGGAGFIVPAGYKFHAVALHAESNADLTGGTATFAVIADGAELANGPTAALADTVQSAVGVKRVGAEPIAAGAVVAVSATTSAAFAPTTADVDAVLIGIMTPA